MNNPLEQYPHLFAEFDCQSIQGEKKAIHKVWWIYKEDKINGTNWISDCTLIARPISDMTNEEISNYSNVNAEGAHAKQIRYTIEHLVNTQNISFHDAKKLLNICVLSFPQSLFDDRIVININEV